MVNVYHHQYPVGQGGLHLGIVGDYAYIYDCGGDSNADWNAHLKDINNKIKHCKELHIFISHLHEDHYNKLSKLLNDIESTPKKIFLPYISVIEKIIFICDYIIQKELSGDINREEEQELQQYIRDVKNDENRYETIRHEKEFEKNVDDIILKSYVTNILPNDERRFSKYLQMEGVDVDDLVNQIKTYNKDFWKKAVTAYRKTFHSARVSHKIMLNLYCGMNEVSIRYDDAIENWLHTGDALMKTNKQIEGFKQNFGNLLNNVNQFQIPHHGSEHNHDWRFSVFCTHCWRKFYLTAQDNPPSNSRKFVTPKIDDITLCRCQSIQKISEKPVTNI